MIEIKLFKNEYTIIEEGEQNKTYYVCSIRRDYCTPYFSIPPTLSEIKFALDPLIKYNNLEAAKEDLNLRIQMDTIMNEYQDKIKNLK